MSVYKCRGREKEYGREYYQANLESERRRYREYYHKLKKDGRHLRWAQKWRARNKEKYKKYMVAWNKANREKQRSYQHAYRAKHKSLLGSECVVKIALLKGKIFCHWCCNKMKNVTIDHVIPLSRGGEHIPDNLVASCRSCNSSKCSNLVEEWLPFQEFCQEVSN